MAAATARHAAGSRAPPDREAASSCFAHLKRQAGSANPASSARIFIVGYQAAGKLPRFTAISTACSVRESAAATLFLPPKASIVSDGVNIITPNTQFVYHIQAEMRANWRLAQNVGGTITVLMTSLPKTHDEIGDRLRRFRETTGLSQKAFAERHGFNNSQYANWENGIRRMPLEQAAKLEQFYGLTLDYLYLGRISALPHKIITAMKLAP